ncbi:hypothetical protein ONZ51_g7890 [Trametes cubensis]|uniref:Yeast cell wall synthesis Kre9/Knh1-like N-terminal domain-containing protein n=1 Tax=Trametes cubensis TaxID=1111947 RepID=A0AAD7X8R3_9APHY|nr:hypothetical protein ONZ51_g7890 [Trametes cubensis]
MFANKFTAIVTALVAAAAAVSAAPSIVFSPPITSPKAGDVWPAGTTQVVTWDTTNIPPANANQTGLILLGYIEDGSEDEHLDIKNPLAVNFPISAGSASVEVPSVTPRDDYVVVLFGDSGNTSPKFTITN